MDRARAWHLLTGVVAAAAVILQLILVIRGGRVLDESSTPDLGTRLVRFISYFTVLSNILVAISCLTLGLRIAHDRREWRVLRLNAIVCITVTAVVHFFLLRPLLDLHGADRWADTLLHVVVPVLAVVGWILFGPRRFVHASDLPASAVFPVAYLAYTLVHGAITDWYPYPFIDVTTLGYGRVLLNTAGIVVLLVLLSWGALRLDPRCPGRALTVGPEAAEPLG